MEVGRIVYSPTYGKQIQKSFLDGKTCECCGTKGKDVKIVKSFGGALCSECRLDWKDYKGF